MVAHNAIYAQSGGVTAVINATASGVIQTARQHKTTIRNVLAAKNGVVGVLREELIDTSRESDRAIEQLRHVPGGAFGSCRFKLQNTDPKDPVVNRLFEVFKAYDVRYFFYNGGGDSQDTLHKIARLGEQFSYPIQCIGIPKTVDNDLAITDCSPGFGSVAKYIAVSTKEAALDVQSMCDTSTKVFILEVMGRHSGWIAAAGGLAGSSPEEPPHIILFPEVIFDAEKFAEAVKQIVNTHGFCVVVASEGIRLSNGQFVAESSSKDAFGHTQLGGVGAILADSIQRDLGYKVHYAIADYLQRAAGHLVSKVDQEQAFNVGKSAVELAVQGARDVMVVIKRLSNNPYRWSIDTADVSQVANIEKTLPSEYIRDDGYGITEEAREYLLPLVSGESFPVYRDGLPDYQLLKLDFVARKLPEFQV